MHLHFERNVNSRCDCPILSLTWMGKVPDELPEDEGWKLNRTNYYQEGWLATGNMRGIVGVTFTTSHCKKTVEYPVRTNYNLRGHRSEVILVKWNEPYQKLASCDSSGIIFVWIKYEGRWSIELINDRNTPVTHFAWSHDGRMALICYNDGFVLVGSVAGQRYWSSMLNLDSTITCGIWTPDDMHVYFGTSQGGVVVMDVHGAMVAQVSLAQAPVTGMAWSCEKFKMEEGDDAEPTESSKLVLAVSVSTGHIYLMKSYDDVAPIQIYTGLGGPLCMEWSNNRQLLAVAGVANHNADNTEYVNMLKCYSDAGQLLYSTIIPFASSPVTALTWGHNDKRLFLATGNVVHIAWVSRRVATLQLLSRLQVAVSLPMGESSVRNLPLPPRLKHLITNLFAQTIRCCIPGPRGIREFVSRAPLNGQRLHCTMIRHDDEYMGSGACYTLYLEYLGGLVPLLKGKRTSKIRPEFVIFDPAEGGVIEVPQKLLSNLASDTSDTEREEMCVGSPRMQRRRRRRRRSPVDLTFEYTDLSYIDTLPENARLVEVTSNIWGTKFKIHGLAECVPANLGQVTYKTSLLHLQPRQMTLVMTELRDDVLLMPDPSFNPNVFSEDEDDERTSIGGTETPSHPAGAIPIAPMTPKNLRQARTPRLLNLNGDAGFIRARAQQRPPFYEDARPGPSRATPPRPLTTADSRGRLTHAPPYTLSHVVQSPDREPVLSPRLLATGIPSFESLLKEPGSEGRGLEALHKPAARSRSEGPISERRPLHRNKSFLEAQTITIQAHVESTPSDVTSPSFHSEIDQIVKRLDEMIERDLRPRLECESRKPNLTRPETDTRPVNLSRPETDTRSFNLSRPESNAQSTIMETSETETSSTNISRTETDSRLTNLPRTETDSSSTNIPRTETDTRPTNFSRPETDTSSTNFSRTDTGPRSTNISRTETDTRSTSISRTETDTRPINLARPESIEDETPYSDCNLNDVIAFGETLKTNFGENFETKPRRMRKRPDKNETCFLNSPSKVLQSPVVATVSCSDPMRISRSCSVGFLDDVDTGRVPGQLSLILLKQDAPKRLFLVRKKPKRKPKPSHSFDSSDFSALRKPQHDKVKEKDPEPVTTPPEAIKPDLPPHSTPEEIVTVTSPTKLQPPPIRRPEEILSISQPASPAMAKKKRNQSASPIRKHFLNSPLLRRRRKSRPESSDDEVTLSGDEAFTNKGHYKDLETFQKAQLRQKLKRGKVSDGGHTPHVRELVMHNKAPMWNENSQVYQLDFGGRVTQESAKNFQIEFKGKQVMQFGRIDGNAYTLDFQYPFSVLQAFAVALANVTQRLK